MTSSAAGYCSACGAPFEAGYHFCARCGAALTPAGAVASVSRMQGHVRLLAILLLLWGILSFGLHLLAVVTAGTVGVFLGNLLDISLSSAAVVPVLVVALGAFFLLTSLLAIVAGVGLLHYRAWGRVLGLVVCALGLLRPPFGTLVGVYGLWVLLSREGEQHYRQQAARATG